MVNLSSDDLAQMSDEELAQLQAKLQVAQMKKQLGKKYQTHQAIEALQSQCYLPRRYMLFCDELKELEPSLIIPTVVENEKIIRFPMFMTLASLRSLMVLISAGSHVVFWFTTLVGSRGNSRV